MRFLLDRFPVTRTKLAKVSMHFNLCTSCVYTHNKNVTHRYRWGWLCFAFGFWTEKWISINVNFTCRILKHTHRGTARKTPPWRIHWIFHSLAGSAAARGWENLVSPGGRILMAKIRISTKDPKVAREKKPLPTIAHYSKNGKPQLLNFRAGLLVHSMGAMIS